MTTSFSSWKVVADTIEQENNSSSNLRSEPDFWIYLRVDKELHSTREEIPTGFIDLIFLKDMNLPYNFYSLNLADGRNDINLIKFMTSQVDCELSILRFREDESIEAGCLFFESVFGNFS